MWVENYGWIITTVLVVLIVYWALLMKTIAEMIRYRANTVVLVFTCLSLGPFPPQVIMGILWIIFWSIFRDRMGAPGNR